ncbi:transposase DNA-binding-containing protein [Sorangium sp. So ce381]|uniref:transposase DNA-binding-containing protein n=1 Tax=Sorangium sp. So ce381 TaxID=3133307 RepID=UPI003F5B4693
MGSPAAEHAAALAEEMSDAHFGDARLSKRQTKLVQKLAQAPDAGAPRGRWGKYDQS